jgi:hypothetical protein
MLYVYAMLDPENPSPHLPLAAIVAELHDALAMADHETGFNDRKAFAILSDAVLETLSQLRDIC